MGRDWHGAQGLADDIRYYGKWMRDEAEKRIGHLYPKVTLPKEYSGGEATVIAWLWSRTVKCPNPACGAQMPLVRSFWLSKKKSKEVWVEPAVDHSVKPPVISFSVKTGKGEPQSGTMNRQGSVCLACGTPVQADYIRAEGKSDRMSVQLMAVIADGKSGRVYLPSTPEQEKIAKQAKPEYRPEQEMPKNPRWFSPPLYGMSTFADLFSPRQLVAVTTFSNLVQEARERMLADAAVERLASDSISPNNGSTGANAYADAVTTYLAIAVDRSADYWSSICSWNVSRDNIRNTFARQAIPLTWDFAETNPFSESSGNFHGAIDWITAVINESFCNAPGEAKQRDATATVNGVVHPMISTDPPYYDNIGYADLSDFFYVWLRRSLKEIYPDLFSTMLVPKTQELVATPYRFEGSKSKAQ